MPLPIMIIIVLLFIIIVVKLAQHGERILRQTFQYEAIEEFVLDRQKKSAQTATEIIERLEQELAARDKILQEHKDLILELYRYRLNTLINERDQLEEEFETLLLEKSDLARDIANQIDNADAEILDIDKLLHG